MEMEWQVVFRRRAIVQMRALHTCSRYHARAIHTCELRLWLVWPNVLATADRDPHIIVEATARKADGDGKGKPPGGGGKGDGKGKKGDKGKGKGAKGDGAAPQA